ncbi:SH3 domain-containing protein [Sutcliffiella deserti]|uniref:SH3 domain-containing protein n=1 Tax=Sutcliffiella deserti TaxID=2875501 RepID=UPI001CBD8AE8|nr:SH3 domain-containing protein [Sutcliffiella deserti]
MHQKLHIFIIGLFLFSTFITFFNTSTAYANRTIEVATDVLNVREKPDANSSIISKVVRGETYPVISTQGEWLKIQVSDSKSGWVASFLVSDNNQPHSSPSVTEASEVQVLTDDLRVRSGPGTNFSVTGFIHSTDEVRYVDENENWIKIRANGIDGWVSKEFIRIQEKDPNETEDPPTSQPEPDDPQTATITTNGLNVRSEPTTQSEVLDSLSEGKVVLVLEQKLNWLKISYDQKTGWIHQDYAKIDNQSSNSTSSNETNSSAIISVSGLNVRSDPSFSGKVIGQVLQGEEVTIVSEKNNWCEIEYESGETGWVAGWFLAKKPLSVDSSSLDGEGTVLILEDGTNIRSEAATSAKVIYRAAEGQSFPIIGVENNWYQIQLQDGTKAYVAGWIVTTKGKAPTFTRAGAEQYLLNKVIVIDPGHGGKDVGAIGAQGTYEKDITLRTSRLLQDKLKAAGATVYLTRQNDTFVSLPVRAQTANHHHADVFLSLHYDSIDDSSVTGTTTYYYDAADKRLANHVHQSLIQFTNLRDRNVRQENYLVLRESLQPSLLLELGYISNRGEELTVLTSEFQERASTAIYQGLAQYFRDR